MEFVNKSTGLSLQIPMRKVKMNICSIGRLHKFRMILIILISGNVPDILLFKELALITIRVM